MKRINISISDTTANSLRLYPEINISEICDIALRVEMTRIWASKQEAGVLAGLSAEVEKALQSLEDNPPRPKRGRPRKK